MDVRQSIDIGAPPERVWPLLVEPDRIKRWYVTLREFRYLEGAPRGPGVRVYAEEKGPGMLMKLDFQATDWIENQVVAYHMTSGTGVRAYDQRWSLDRVPTGSRFTFSEHVELPFGAVGRLIGRVAERSSAGHVKEMLAKLKSLAEAEAR